MDTERGPSPGGTTRHGQELARHVREGRLDAARHAVDGMLEAEGLDEVLAVLAPLTSTGHDALTLFLETLDGSGVVRIARPCTPGGPRSGPRRASIPWRS